MTTNLQNVFDAIVGYDGSADVDGWRDMTRDDLVAQADAQADNFYESITDAQAQQIADAVIAYRDCDNSNDAYHVRESLGDEPKINAHSQIFGRINDAGNVDVLMTEDGSPCTRIDENVYPVGSSLSARHEHPDGIVLSSADAKKIGIEIE